MLMPWIGNLHINYGPKTEKHPTKLQRSAGWCPRCKQRRVQTLVANVPVEPSYYGPHFHWECPCGGSVPAPEYGE